MGIFGYLIGLFIMGVVFDKKILDWNLLMFLFMMGYGVIIVIVLWCSLFEVMVFIYVMKGVFGGGLDMCKLNMNFLGKFNIYFFFLNININV